MPQEQKLLMVMLPDPPTVTLPLKVFVPVALLKFKAPFIVLLPVTVIVHRPTSDAAPASTSKVVASLITPVLVPEMEDDAPLMVNPALSEMTSPMVKLRFPFAAIVNIPLKFFVPAVLFENESWPFSVVAPETVRSIPSMLEVAPAETVKIPPTVNTRLDELPVIEAVPFIIRFPEAVSVRVFVVKARVPLTVRSVHDWLVVRFTMSPAAI